MEPNAAIGVSSAEPAPTSEPGQGSASYRYGAVMWLTLLLVFFQIAAPDSTWSHAVNLALEGAALLVVAATSRARASVRRERAIAVGLAAALVVLAVGAGVVGSGVAVVLGVMLGAAIPLTLVNGLLRLIRNHGVTVQAVAGALTIYLLLGLLFAWMIAVAAHFMDGHYFIQGTNGSQSQRVYYSFTVLTTTGLGDLTAGTSFGRALAVTEMLVGQLYLVTVISVLVSGMSGRSVGRDAGA
jgi:hypothetical protein